MTTQDQTIGCVKSATEILGNKWTPRLLREFFLHDTVRFCQLQDLVGGINPRTLSARLGDLEENKIIERTSPHASRCEYRLTERGRALLPILDSMSEWSRKYGEPASEISQNRMI